MNSRERVAAALERRRPDRVPHFEFVTDSLVMNAIRPGADLLDFTDYMDLDAVAIRPGQQKKQLSDSGDTVQDERGLVLKKSVTQEYFEPVAPVIKDEQDLRRFEFPDPRAPHRLAELQKAIARFCGKRAIIVFLRDGWSEARDLHGYVETLVDLADRPKLIRNIIEKAVDYYSELGRLAAELGADIGFSGDDIAGKNGPLMSPSHFREILAPAMKRLYKNWHDCGLYVIKHTDGNIEPILEDLIDTGLDCLNPIDPSAGMSLAKVKQRYGSRICIMGNVDCAGSLVSGTEEDVVTEVRACLDAAADGGGYILSSSNSIHRDVKPENYVAMVSAVKQYGRYS
jgi:uroporphyrinogen decarboxylase